MSSNTVTHTRVNEIDLLRFIAAGLVLLFHYSFRGHAADGLLPVGYPMLAPLTMYGYLGVDLFFMISGFVILMSATGASVGSFVASRVARLYPAFWICCTLTFIMIALMGAPRFTASLPQYAVNMTMLSGFVGVPSIDGVYWSLFVELKFYALVALLLVLRQIHALERYVLGWLALSAAAEWVPLSKLGVLLLDGYAPLFAAGALSYLIFSRGPSAVRLAGFGAAWLLALRHALQNARELAVHFQRPFDDLWIGAIVSICFIVLLAVGLRRTGYVGKRQWTLLGALTYPLYLLHQNIGYMFFWFGSTRVDPTLLFVLVVAAALLSAYIVHRFVERPLGPWLRRTLERGLIPRLPGPLQRALARG